MTEFANQHRLPTAQADRNEGRRVMRASTATAQLEAMDELANRSDNVQRVAQLSAVVQRTITVNGKVLTPDRAANVVFARNADARHNATAVFEIADQFNQENRTFVDDDELYAAVMAEFADTDEEEEEEEEDEERKDEDSDEETGPYFDPGLWRDEPEDWKTNDLGESYKKGAALRKGIDYKTVDKSAYAVQGNDDLALVIRGRREKGSASLKAEVDQLAHLRAQKMSAAKVHETGYYVIGGAAHPAMLMTRYAISSKAFVRRKNGKILRPADYKKSLADVFDTKKKIAIGLALLGQIKQQINSSKGKLAVDDIQFLVAEDGEFFINDASQTGSGFQESNNEVIDELTLVLEEWKIDIDRPTTGPSTSITNAYNEGEFL